MTGWELIKAHFQQPEYLHVLLNPLPIYGLALGLIAMVLALSLHHRKARAVALSIVFVSALSAWPVTEFGEQGYDRMASLTDKDGNAWLQAHRDRAESVLWVFYLVSALSAGAIFVPTKWPRTAVPLLLLTIVGTGAALGCGAWIGYAGGQITHKEFRYGPPPKHSPDKDSL